MKGVFLHWIKHQVQEKSKDLNIRELIEKNKSTVSTGSVIEKIMPTLLVIISIISVLITFGIVITLLAETIEFFKDVLCLDFYTGTILKPLGDNAQFGIFPLVTGTLISTVIAMVVAIPIGLMSAIYLSEYASDKVRKVVKPSLGIACWNSNDCLWILCTYICYPPIRDLLYQH